MPADYLHIYLVDDDDDDCLLFEDVLNELEFPSKLTTVANGFELLDALNRIEHVADFPHLIFLDLNMPIKNGIECLIEIKQSPQLCHLPIVMYSTSASREFVDIAFENGALMFFKKPDSFIKLKQVLEKILPAKWNGEFSKPNREEFLIDI